MVKKTITVTTILLILTMVVSLIIVLNKSSFAADDNGPGENARIIVEGWNYIYSKNSSYETTTVENAYYSEETNTLVLDNYNGEFIYACDMGKDFKIELIGHNSIDKVYSYSNPYSCIRGRN